MRGAPYEISSFVLLIFNFHYFATPSRASVSQEGGIKNPRAKALWDKWRHVWMMAWERDRRLRDKLNYLQVRPVSFLNSGTSGATCG